jgi:hypothetical protein
LSRYELSVPELVIAFQNSTKNYILLLSYVDGAFYVLEAIVYTHTHTHDWDSFHKIFILKNKIRTRINNVMILSKAFLALFPPAAPGWLSISTSSRI